MKLPRALFFLGVYFFLSPVRGNSQPGGGLIDTTFHIGSGASSPVNTINVLEDGKIIVGGWFDSFNGAQANLLVRLNEDGTVDQSFTAAKLGWASDDKVLAALALPNGKIIVGGTFTKANGLGDSGIKMLNSDGSLDQSFQGNAIGNIRCMTMQVDGKVLLAGLCSEYSGTSTKNIFRINPDGTIDSTFATMTTGANAGINSIALQPDGKIIIGGYFTDYQGNVANRIARLNTNGSIDFLFDIGTGANDYISSNSIAIQSDGKIICGGRFTEYNGVYKNYLMRLNIDGSVDTTFNLGGVGLNTWASCVFVQVDDKILIGGTFSEYNSTAAIGLARLKNDGQLDTSFDAQSSVGSDGQINMMANQSDNKLLIGGIFTSYQGYPSKHVCRIYGDYSSGVFESKEIGFSIFPNPSSSSIQIKHSGQEGSVTLFNTMGVIVYAEKLKKEQATINTSTFPPGLYYVKVGEKVKKLVIE
jgi:uncharacterized delta-60 repeat protein